ncbi:MAG TPA: vanadium-dependent haloperoxidase [Polyangiaceae bacterium]|nr:vanadium-dependent haloperoxidase [Polyangiaceae bacterium]
MERANEVSHSLDATEFPAHYARQWMTNVANSVKYDGISPPVAARAYTYTSVALYESVVHGIPGARSLAGQLNGLDALPLPAAGLAYDWPTVLAHTMDRLVRHELPGTVFVFPNRLFFEFTTFTQASLWILGPTQIGYRRAAGVPPAVIDNSIAYADQLADALIPWVLADGYFAVRYKGYIPPEGPQYWAPTGFSDADKVANPDEPNFGKVRTLVLAGPEECEAPPPPPFSTDPSSAMYAEANAVYQTDVNLTDPQIEIARFWADGPRDTATPAGHWVAIATQFLRPKTLAEAVTGYAQTSLGYLDAFVSVWHTKYKYSLLRPETYIRRHIDPFWRPLLPTPQFPEYVSGHSAQSMAAAVLFTDTFGAGPFTDNTKLRRGFGPRSFASFTDAAFEASASRQYGGIHYPVGNAEGRDMGVCVGNAVRDRVHFAL